MRKLSRAEGLSGMLIQNIAYATTYKKFNLQLNEDRYVTKYSLGAQIIDVMLFAVAIIIQRSFFCLQKIHVY